MRVGGLNLVTNLYGITSAQYTLLRTPTTNPTQGSECYDFIGRHSIGRIQIVFGY